MSAGTDIAPEPRVWVCAACGKRARSRYGFDADGKSTALDRGWSVSCMLHAVLCEPTSKDERELREQCAPSDAGAGYPLWKAVEEETDHA